MASFIPEVFMFANPFGDFGFDGRREHLLERLGEGSQSARHGSWMETRRSLW